MTGVPRGMLRVTRHRKCPICGKPNWCLLAEDGSRAICQRLESTRRAGEAGWLHVLHASSEPYVARKVTIELRDHDFGRYAESARQFRSPDGPGSVHPLAVELGVSAASLNRLAVGWDRGLWMFPMSDSCGRTIGIRCRSSRGSKFAVKGSRQGLFIPSGLGSCARLLVVEGPTDTAAALDLGYDAIGRPSCNGGVDQVRSYVRAKGCRDVVVIADRDEAGQSGARNLARTLALVTRVRVAEPPEGMKDLREWLRAGARRQQVDDLIARSAAVPVRLEARP
jgi:hypothetical protein